MSRINSKAKGSKNERDVCKWWESWTGYEFSRVPSSGGLRWGRTTDTTGDIICSDQKHFLRFPFSIECKNYKDINFEHLLLGNKRVKILEFWNQALEDAERGHKIPILMMRYNGMKKGEYFFVVESNLAHVILNSMDLVQSAYIPKMDIRNNDIKLTILMASDIKSLADYQKVNKESRKRLKLSKK
jgi:hypothetical protein